MVTRQRDVERRKREREAKRDEIRRARYDTANKPPSGLPAKGMNSVAKELNRVQKRYEAMSVYGALLLMPDPEGLQRARLVTCANAHAAYGLSEVEDAALLMATLGILPLRKEDDDGAEI